MPRSIELSIACRKRSAYQPIRFAASCKRPKCCSLSVCHRNCPFVASAVLKFSTFTKQLVGRFLLAIMILGRILSSTLTRTRLIPYAQPQLLNQQKNLDNRAKTTDGQIQNLKNAERRPLLIMLSWLLANRKHITKFLNLYTEQGFDVALVSTTPWQLLWPISGSRVVAKDLLDFLLANENYQQILLHGFSVGGYMWGEVIDIFQNDSQKYGNVLDRIVGQVWDSLADVSELSIGTPRAVFPKNKVLQNMVQKYLEFHMRTFYKSSTQYYKRSSQLFHSNIVHSPALFFVSKVDPVGTITNNMKVRDRWDSLGVKTYVKIFEDSPHVGHFQRYPKEYVGELYAFLNELNLIQNEEKMRARL
ncbi:transmembrane protein 53-B isoform X2 [Hylaeus volcanicus]|uniref:transmembrane protein 53-B isoform X2 n=2 Tax=Hylaeus volcanicus TaxID=313075 RepID=UPI0023B7CB76|nr:transmembrane protein 53-B isoform X2 [Hylaeus volcanicus]